MLFRRIHRLVLLTLMVVGVVSYVSSASTYSGSCGTGISWQMSDADGVLHVTGTGAMQDFASDESALFTLDPVRTLTTTISIESGITHIGSYCFRGMPNVVSVTIASTVTSIGSYAFTNCSKLKDFYVSWTGTIPTWPTGMTNGSGIRLHVPCGTKSKYQAATGWKTYTVIEEAAGGPCGENGNNVMWTVSCDGKTLTFSGSGNMGGWFVNSSNNGTPWAAYQKTITKVVIGGGITSIGQSAFYGFTNLTSVTIASSVTSLTKGAFHACENLTSLTLPANVTFIGQECFSYCTKLASINIPSKVVEIDWRAFYECDALTSITIPNSVTTMETTVFDNCDNLTTVVIGSGMTTIPDYTFRECVSLSSVTLPSHLVSIGIDAFYDCAMSSITFPSTLTSIGQRAFGQCKNLTSVTIPNSVTTMGGGVFSNCTGLTSVKLSNQVTELPSSLFSGCTGLLSVTIPSGVTKIGFYVFQNCSTLVSVTIPNTVTTIAAGAFQTCTSLPAITIPSSVTTMGNFIFQNCNNLADMYVSWTSSIPTWNNLTNQPAAGITLHIPCGSGDLYRAASGWKNCTIRSDADGYSLSAQSDDSAHGEVKIDEETASGSVSITSYCESTHMLTAIPGCQYVFSRWSDGNMNNPRKVSLTDPSTSYIAEFKPIEGICGTDLHWAFNSCTGELTISGTGAMTNWSGTSGIPWYRYRSSIRKITIGDGITSIGNRAFYNCTALTEISIPVGITTLGERAFYGCSALSDIDVHWTENIPSWPTLFTNKTASSIHLHVPCDKEELYRAAPGWQDYNIVADGQITVTVQTATGDTSQGTVSITALP